MNKAILTSRAVLGHVISASRTLARRICCFIQRKPYSRGHGPQWQQLELPFSRTPVRRWNR